MSKYLLGALTGVLGTAMYFAEPGPAWYVWILFLIGSALVTLSFDVFLGSLEEHQTRAAWTGLTMFGGPGVLLLLIVLKAGF